MKKYLLFLLSLSLGLPIMAQDRADRQYLKDPKSFSMILLGDPQGYTKFDMNQPLFDLCTAWIEDNIDQLNIKAVLCTGDIVEQNDNLDTKQKITNQTGHEMWMAGASEVIYSMLMMKNNFIAANLNFENPDEDSAKLYIPAQRIETGFDTFLSNSFGFGGTNSTLIVRNL